MIWYGGFCCLYASEGDNTLALSGARVLLMYSSGPESKVRPWCTYYLVLVSIMSRNILSTEFVGISNSGYLTVARWPPRQTG
jgi:hypothetical protein